MTMKNLRVKFWVLASTWNNERGEYSGKWHLFRKCSVIAAVPDDDLDVVDEPAVYVTIPAVIDGLCGKCRDHPLHIFDPAVELQAEADAIRAKHRKKPPS